MDYSIIPCCYLPSKVIVIDDNSEFLKSVKSIFALSGHYVTYTSPFKALAYLNEQYHCVRSENVQILEDQGLDHTFFSVNIRNIHQEIYNPERFNEISVLVTDYAMPGIDGLSLCKRVNAKNIKRILLTGEAGLELAVQAFNEHIIDQFILKSELQLNQTIKQSIKNAQMAYYFESTQQAAEHVLCLHDPVFVAAFQEIQKQYDIAEFYLLDSQGSFLMLDIEANPFWFIVKDEEEMSGLQEMAEMADAPDSVLDALKSRTKIPYFYSEQDFKIAPSAWEKYMHPAKVLEGKKLYYYAFFSDTTLYPLEKDKIVSYQTFLQQMK